jgi:hypothetical protein
LTVGGLFGALSAQQRLFEFAPAFDVQYIGDLIQLLVIQIQLVMAEVFLVITASVDSRTSAHGNLRFICPADIEPARQDLLAKKHTSN